MKLLGWTYFALALIAAVPLGVSFFVNDVNPISQLALLIQGVGYGFVSGLALGLWRGRDE